MDRHYYDQLIGWILVVVSLFLMVATLKGRYGSGPLLPSLIPWFGIPFAIGALVALILFCLWQKSNTNVILVIVVFTVGFLLGYIGESNAKSRSPQPTPAIEKILNEQGIIHLNYNWSRHRFICGICLSSLALGGKLLRENSAL